MLKLKTGEKHMLVNKKIFIELSKLRNASCRYGCSPNYSRIFFS
jgi:hypothetical protein